MLVNSYKTLVSVLQLIHNSHMTITIHIPQDMVQKFGADTVRVFVVFRVHTVCEYNAY